MGLFKNRVYLSVLLSFGLLVSGCGGDPEEGQALEITEGPPQVTITLHSQLELDYSLDPDPQLQVSQAETDEFGEVDNKFIAGVYAKLKRSAMLRSQSGRKPAFKTDTEYLSIQRYEEIDTERYAITIEKSPQKSQIRKTVTVQDKPLVFAGRGYNISAFERESKPAIDVDYATHLVAVQDDPTGSHLRERLDPKMGYSRDTKYLVYNSTRSAFGKLPPPLVESKPEPSRKVEPVIPPERNPDSVLLFPKGEKSVLVLRKAEKQFDLLVGNESLNKKQFEVSKVPGTSKKIPKTLQ
ncbi:MAG: hypothetical protein H8E42_05520 [Nitrospinae bacterium]|nr:hypothetical protein [Nitrospinota bacterium]MBL7018925.1 hypothetical protein [Nitrospinaceae bacterium]